MMASSPRCRRVAVIGAGVAGLAALKTCKEEGMDVIGYDSRPEIGGIWSGTSDQRGDQGPGMYSCLVTNTSKATTCFSDFPCPKDYPSYMTHWMFQDYIKTYAEHFELTQHFQLNTKVTGISKTPDHDTTGRWMVKLVTSDGQSHEEVFDGVIVCAGFFSKARTLSVPGLKDKFKGRVIHSREYKDAISFKDRTVLVVGNASSAGDIACDVSNLAKQVYMSVGSGMCLLKRVTPSCLPADLALKRIFTEIFDQNILFPIFQKIANKGFNHVNACLKVSSKKRLVDSPILVCDDLPVRIISGKVKVISYVKEYCENEIVTDNGDVYSGIDDVILAIGYDRDLSTLDPSLGCGESKLELYKQVFPLKDKHHTLALVGCQRSVGPVVPVLEVQARLAAYTLSGTHQLPPLHVMQRDVAKFNKMAQRPDGTYHYSFLSSFFSDNVAGEMGVKPSFWKLILSGKPRLAWKCFFGPVLPCQYRIMGPGKWEGAEQVINDVIDDCLTPLKSRPIDEATVSKKPKVFLALFSLSLVSLAVALQFWSFQELKDLFTDM